MTSRRAAGWMLLAVLAAAVAAWVLFTGGDEPSAIGPRSGPGELVPPGDAEPPPDVAPVPPPRGEAPKDAARPRRRAAAELPAAPPAPAESQAESPDAVFIHGVVTLAGGGPAAGAEVKIWKVDADRSGAPRRPIAAVTVGADGRFMAGGAVSGVRVVIYASHPGMESTGTVFTPSIGGAEVFLMLGDGGSVKGVVRNADGSPSPGREVVLAPADRWRHHAKSGDWRFWAEPDVWDAYLARTVTGADGAYSFSGIAADAGRSRARPRVVFARDDDGHAWAADAFAISGPGRTEVRDILLGSTPWTGDSVDPPGVVRSVGVRVLAPDGTDVADATVRYAAFSEARIVWWPARGESGGVWTAAIPQGEFVDEDARMRLSVAAPGYLPWSGFVDSRDVTVRLEPSAETERGRIAGELSTGTHAMTLPAYAELRVVDLVTFERQRIGIFVAADGTFAAEGVPAGPKLASFDDLRHWREIAVPPGGQTWDRYVSDRTLEALHPQEKVARNLARREELQRELQSLLFRNDADENRIAEAELLLSEVGERLRGRVEGEIPGGGNGWATVKSGNVLFTAALRDGRVEYPTLPPGSYPATISRRGRADERVKIDLRPTR